MFNDSRIFISGATGSWGNTLVKKLLKDYTPKEIICYSRGELQQVLMARKFNNKIMRYEVGDVRDYDCVKECMRGVDYVFHLAALKHVPICEEHSEEAIKTNINGTLNVIKSSVANGVKKVIDVSTDKAASPLNLYGLTKAIGEKLIINSSNKSETGFVCVRGGNVMGSNGSVIPLFIDQIKKGGPITITDLRMTRYFITLEEAIDLLFVAAEASNTGETYVIKMPSCYIKDLAEVLMETYGKVDIKEIGIREGEKLDEVLVTEYESPRCYIHGKNHYVITPKKIKKKPVDFEKFSSKTYLMNKKQIRDMLKKGGFV